AFSTALPQQDCTKALALRRALQHSQRFLPPTFCPAASHFGSSPTLSPADASCHTILARSCSSLGGCWFPFTCSLPAVGAASFRSACLFCCISQPPSSGVPHSKSPWHSPPEPFGA